MGDFRGFPPIFAHFCRKIIKVLKIILKKFGSKYYFYYLCTQKTKNAECDAKN